MKLIATTLIVLLMSGLNVEAQGKDTSLVFNYFVDWGSAQPGQVAREKYFLIETSLKKQKLGKNCEMEYFNGPNLVKIHPDYQVTFKMSCILTTVEELKKFVEIELSDIVGFRIFSGDRVFSGLQAVPAQSRFFANESVQKKSPKAFVLQKSAEPFLRSMESHSRVDRAALIKKIESDAELLTAIRNWQSLSISEQIPFLKKIFALEVSVLKIQAPELIFGSEEIPGRAAYFDFDLSKLGAGRVLLNPEVLQKEKNQYTSLALLLHETRHSAQFQLANSSDSDTASVYLTAFQAQKSLKITSFCDFLTLAHEHEAFQFGNYILGRLTQWQVNMPDMGTYASQYDDQGKLKIDLLQVLDNQDSRSLLEKFNDLEMEQCKLLGACD